MARLYILIMGLCLLLVSCDINSADENGNGALPTDVSYSSDIQPILNKSCAGSSCYVGESINGVRLDSYEDTKNSMGLTYEKLVVQPGNPEESPLVDKIEPNPDV